jgi:signal peptidase I
VANLVPPTSSQDEPRHLDADRGVEGGDLDPGKAGVDRDTGMGEPGKNEKKGSFWKELPILVLAALVLTFLIQTFLARVYVIPSASMERTLHGCNGCSNDRVLADKVTYAFTDPSPGDVVVFRGPRSWAPEYQDARSGNMVVRWVQDFGSALGIGAPNERDFIKRIIAVGGQTVECCDQQGRVKVDGKALDEPYIHYQPGFGNQMQPFEKVTVPPGELWMMGDNRNNSSDSRASGHGTVPTDNVIGKARVVVMPFDRWQGIDDHNPQNVALGTSDRSHGVPVDAGFALAFPVVLLARRPLSRIGPTVADEP